MVGSVSQASNACVNGDAVGAEKFYQQFQNNLLIFLDRKFSFFYILKFFKFDVEKIFFNSKII